MSKHDHIHVTDHAVVRYLERVHFVNVSAIRRRIKKAVYSAVKHGSNGIIKDGITYKLKGRTVTTILSNENRKRRHLRRKIKRSSI